MSKIPHSVRAAEVGAVGKSIFEYDSKEDPFLPNFFAKFVAAHQEYR